MKTPKTSPTRAGQVLMIAGILFYMGLYIFRIAYGGWHESMWVPLVLGTLLFFGGVIKDRKGIASFFTMRTTQQGLNLGAVLLLTLIGLACVNSFAVRYDKKFDWTSDQLNSLSEQSKKIAESISNDTQLVLLYRNDTQGTENIPRVIGDQAKRYTTLNNRIKFTSTNAIVDPGTARQYDYSQGPFALFAVQNGRKVKIDQPTEEGITRALIKLTHEKRKVIYFTIGHGEADLESRDPDGLSFLKEQLSVNYDVRNLTLYQSDNKIPADASAVAIIGPKQQFLDSEIKALREYVQLRSGRLFLAIDPGVKHGLAGLSHAFGIEFNNDYIVDDREQVVRGGSTVVLGATFPDATDVTRSFGEGQFGVFAVASSLKTASDAPKNAKISSIIATDIRNMTTRELGAIQFKPNGPHVIGMMATSDKSEVIVFGDSDFLTNRLIQNNLNNDLTQNSFSELASDQDLLSIRPRSPKATMLAMSKSDFSLYALLFLLPLPILLFAGGSFLWTCRRTA